MEFVILTLVSLIVAFVAMHVSMHIARQCNFVDKPDARKRHLAPTPLIGGIGLFFALGSMILLGTFWDFAKWPDYSLGLVFGISLMLLVGILDDRKPIRARYRFIAQIVCGLSAVVMGGTVIQALGDVFAPIKIGLSFMAIPFTVIAITGIINAFNMSDGVDGLCSGYSVVALGCFIACMVLIDNPAIGVNAISELAPVLVPAAAAGIVFLLCFNLRILRRSRATAFLGDNGSMILGLLVAWVAVRLTAGFGNGKGIDPVVALWIVTLPLFDMIACMIRRYYIERKTPMTADRRHLHHMLLAHGLTDAEAVAALIGGSASLGFVGILGWQVGVPQYMMFWALFAGLVGYVAFHCRFWQKQDDSLPATEAEVPATQSRQAAVQ